MVKKQFIRLGKCLAVLLPVILIVSFLQSTLFSHVDHCTERIRYFYQEEEDSLDVVLLGASEVYADYSPVLAYERFGITSFGYTQDSNPGSLYKYQVREILSRQSPQVLLVEVNGFLYPKDTYQYNEARLRVFTESIPMSRNKLEAIWEFPGADRLSCLIPFIKYHGDWSNPDVLQERVEWRTYTRNTPSPLKGFRTWSLIDTAEPELAYQPEPDPKIAEDELIEFLEFCREEGIDNIVFIRFPHKNSGVLAPRVERIAKIIEQYGYPFVSTEDAAGEMELDYLHDFYNREHLNIYGVAKFTVYLGNYLVEDLGVTPREQSPENRQRWEACIPYHHALYAYVDSLIQNKTRFNFIEKPAHIELLDITEK